MQNRESIQIPIPKNFNFKNCIPQIDRRYEESLYKVENGCIRRLIRLSSGAALIEITADINFMNIQLTKEDISQQDLLESQKYVTEWFDMDRDISLFYDLLRKYPQTKEFPKLFQGLRIIGIPDLFEALCWCVIGQQINLTFAHKVKNRLVQRYGKSRMINDNTYYIFPTPSDLLHVDREEFVKMEFSKQKIDYIQNVSEAFCSGVLKKSELKSLSKSDQMNKLLSIKGIGPWTANYVMMKSLGDMTCITYGDTGLSAALHTLFDTDKKPNKSTIDTIFEPFTGWESYLNFYLWSSLSND